MNDGIPLYKKLEQKIKEHIASGVYKVGEKLPTEKIICERFGISRSTVRRTLIELEKQNIISARQGSGIYVQSYLFQQSLKRFYSFSQEMRRIGKRPSNKIVSFDTITATELVRQKLELKKRSKVLKIVRIRLADNEPYMYAVTYLPQNVFHNLTQDMFENHDLYELMRKRYDIVFTKAVESFSAVPCDEEASTYLSIPKDSACMRVTRQAFALHSIVEYTQSIACGNKFSFLLTLPM